MRVIAQKGNGSFMSARGKKSGLIQNGGVMTSRDSMPVLGFGDGVNGVWELIWPTLNFLRGECPGVQWLIGFVPGGNGVTAEWYRQIVTDGIQSMLTNATIPGEETFKIECNIAWTIGDVITITRKVPSELATRPVAYALHCNSSRSEPR